MRLTPGELPLLLLLLLLIPAAPAAAVPLLLLCPFDPSYRRLL
uniref:Uncharacterized protein n=1 Tax=Arundo donax TaxID=35708 RepID=A0A0A9C2D5_ARUDO